MNNIITRILALLLLICFSNCTDKYLRGNPVPSKDGKTYLVIDDDAGGNCTLLLDGKKWPYSKNQPGLVTPGKHVLECWIDVTFIIEKGTIFHFNYWGP